jgi:hypothetical protein
MQKLRLDIATLRVESFTLDAASVRQVGTVHARSRDEVFDPDFYDIGTTIGGTGTVPTLGTCIGPTYCCPATWKATCPATCYNTCLVSCQYCI